VLPAAALPHRAAVLAAAAAAPTPPPVLLPPALHRRAVLLPRAGLHRRAPHHRTAAAPPTGCPNLILCCSSGLRVIGESASARASMLPRASSSLRSSTGRRYLGRSSQSSRSAASVPNISLPALPQSAGAAPLPRSGDCRRHGTDRRHGRSDALRQQFGYDGSCRRGGHRLGIDGWHDDLSSSAPAPTRRAVRRFRERLSAPIRRLWPRLSCGSASSQAMDLIRARQIGHLASRAADRPESARRLGQGRIST